MFVCLGVVHIVYFYFFLPEVILPTGLYRSLMLTLTQTTGLALEEIDVLFGKQPVSRLHEMDGQLQEKKISAHAEEVGP